MPQQHHRTHPYIVIALLTTWIIQIIPASSFYVAQSRPFSAWLPATSFRSPVDLNWAASKDYQTIDPTSRYNRLVFASEADRNLEGLPTLSEFVHQVSDGRELTVRGVYVPGVLALPVVQQPYGSNTYVSTNLGTVTQFQLAAIYHVIGLLAHNYLSGSLFNQLKVGQDVYAVMGNGTIQRYEISSIHKFQKRTPSNPNSNYIDLQSGKQLSMRQVFRRFYQGDHSIVFQTCLEKNGNLAWGLMFVQAEPIIAPVFTFSQDYPRR